MASNRTLLGLIFAALVAFWTVGFATSAMAVAPTRPATHMPANPDCPDSDKAQDCALFCTILCNALVPNMALQSDLAPVVEKLFWRNPVARLSKKYGPDPPPPRTIG